VYIDTWKRLETQIWSKIGICLLFKHLKTKTHSFLNEKHWFSLNLIAKTTSPGAGELVPTQGSWKYRCIGPFLTSLKAF